ncbi:MAG TPA: hypothetical protein VH277_20530, partial [Gemmatimonadaceae bacterium]|nr:hypothetical protein [Gemmatimonadaceae bacterium]
MKALMNLGFAAAAASVFAGAALAQTNKQASGSATGSASGTVATDSTTKKENPVSVSLFRPSEVDHFRPADSRGLNMFETPKESSVLFTGFALSIGGAFTQEFQGLSHSNTALPSIATGTTVDANQLIPLGHGFNNAVANLNLTAQVAPGIRIAMTSYLS